MTRWWIYAIIAACLIMAFVPYDQTIAPDWDVLVVDEHGTAVAGANVREFWQQYSVDDSFHEEILKTDDAGRVHFPTRTMHLSLFGNLAGCVQQVKRYFPHGSCGAHAMLVVYRKDYISDWNASINNIREGSPGLRSHKNSKLILVKCLHPDKLGMACLDDHNSHDNPRVEVN